MDNLDVKAGSNPYQITRPCGASGAKRRQATPLTQETACRAHRGQWRCTAWRTTKDHTSKASKSSRPHLEQISKDMHPPKGGPVTMAIAPVMQGGSCKPAGSGKQPNYTEQAAFCPHRPPPPQALCVAEDPISKVFS